MTKGSDHDHLYRISLNGEDRKCHDCNWTQHEAVWILAETQEEALKIYSEGKGLCGACMCEVIEDCEISTPRELLHDDQRPMRLLQQI